MKKTIKTIGMAVVMSITAILFNGCAGKDGAPGAQGPQGNANVLSYTFSVSSWTYTAPNLWADLVDPDITSDVINNGAVLVYINNGGNLTQLPYTYYPTNTYSETMSAIHSVGNVQINLTDSDLNPPGIPSSTLVFKVVTLPSRKPLSNPHINFKDYESVKKAFDLKD